MLLLGSTDIRNIELCRVFRTFDESDPIGSVASLHTSGSTPVNYKCH